MRVLISIACFALLALSACTEEPATGVSTAEAGGEPTAKIHLVNGENVIVMHQGNAHILIPIDAVLARAIQVVNGEIIPVTRPTDIASVFVATCPCCKAGCADFCVPPVPCDQQIEMQEESAIEFPACPRM